MRTFSNPAIFLRASNCTCSGSEVEKPFTYTSTVFQPSGSTEYLVAVFGGEAVYLIFYGRAVSWSRTLDPAAEHRRFIKTLAESVMHLLRGVGHMTASLELERLRISVENLPGFTSPGCSSILL